MGKHTVTLFNPYPFQEGQKIHIESGPRQGDWEVIGLTDKKVTLKCPVSHRELEWNRFCYFVEEQEGADWPRKD